ncbi:retron St85 family effector protein [Pseudomonas oryzihabitans]|uniref:retron St85 family effector protein n=1 Tax=Pseudomonas oryzihabitans TaxID=47885 RepID=UPI00119D6565|nr:retron St85 family effector protein [Pseudomonas oryzihabitans]
MSPEDKRERQLSQISLENSRVFLEPPTVFLCGGDTDVTHPAPVSVRGALVSHLHKVGCILADSITLAESFKDWIHDAVYQDLLVFESDIAHISSLIVIILESPGALAELGLFVRNNVLHKKMLVFIKEEHFVQDSFIKLGPLRYLDAVRPGSVYSYPWEVDSTTGRPILEGALKATLLHMRDDIIAVIKSQDKTEQFDIKNEGHISFLIYELINNFRALKLTEIESYLKLFDIALRREKLKRLIFLLEKFNFVGIARNGHLDYYYPLRDIKKIDFSGRFDSAATKVLSMKFYVTNPGESRRLHVIKTKIIIPEADSSAASVDLEAKK